MVRLSFCLGHRRSHFTVSHQGSAPCCLACGGCYAPFACGSCFSRLQASVHDDDVWWCVWHEQRGRKLRRARPWVINHCSLTREHTHSHVQMCSYEARCWVGRCNKSEHSHNDWMYIQYMCVHILHVHIQKWADSWATHFSLLDFPSSHTPPSFQSSLCVPKASRTQLDLADSGSPQVRFCT